MTNKIVNGDYQVGTFEFDAVKVDYIDELVQNIQIILTMRRGSFYPNKDFGSLIRKEQLGEPKEEYALAYARQALDCLDGVFVKSALVTESKITFNIDINDVERQVSIELENNL